MAFVEKHTHFHFHNDNKEIICLLKEIRDAIKGGSDAKVKELEKQMDGWLLSMGKAFEKLEDVSKKV